MTRTTTRRAVLAGAVLVGLVALPPRAQPARAAWNCTVAAEAAAQPASHPLGTAAERIFTRMADVMHALTGRTVEVRVLPHGGFPRSAVTCPRTPSAPPRVYVTSELLDLVADKPYPYDFLAFVLGHELGHRLVDLDLAGAPRPPGLSGLEVEQRADARGAFLAAAAGYTMSKVACGELLDTYLSEYRSKPGASGVSEETRRQRQDRLEDVLAHLEGWEALFQAGTGLALSGEAKHGEAARELLQWAGRALEDRGIVVPELQVMRALALLTEVAPRTSPLKRAGLPFDPSWVRCEPVFPGQTRLAKAARVARGRPSPADVAALKQARALLEEAGRQGAGELVVASGLACVAWNLGEADAASASLAVAERAAKAARAPEAVMDTLAANRALLAFSGWLASSPPPDEADTAASRSWARALAKEARAFEEHPGVAAVVAALKGYPRVDKAALKRADGLGKLARCKAPPAGPDDLPVRLPAFPKTSREAMGCPCGWTALQSLEHAVEGQAPGRAEVCVPVGWARGVRLVRFAPPRARAPVSDVLLVDTPDGALREVGTWTSTCSVPPEPRGVSDDGVRALAARCHELGLPRGLLFADGCRVERAMVLP